MAGVARDRWPHCRAYCQRINVDLFLTFVSRGAWARGFSLSAKRALPEFLKYGERKRGTGKLGQIDTGQIYVRQKFELEACMPGRVESIFGNRKAIMAAERPEANLRLDGAQPNRAVYRAISARQASFPPDEHALLLHASIRR